MVASFSDESADRGFRRDPDSTDISDLNRFLRSYGLKEELNDLVDDDGLVDLGAVIERVPKEAHGGPANEYGQNNAHEALRSYYEAIPPDQRADGGIKMSPDKILTLLLNETEYYHELADGLVRLCNGEECAHFNVCDFKERARGNKHRDGVECMVDRKVIQDAVRTFVDPPDGKAKIDTRHPAQELLFKQLVQLLVKQKRITMHMQQSPVIVDNWEILQDGKIEHFDAMNKQEHALVKTWDRTHQRINKVLRAMGVTPRFEIQQDRFDLEEEQLDAEERADELYLERVEESLRQIRELSAGGEKMSPEEAVERALEGLASKRKELEGEVEHQPENDDIE